MSLRSDDLTNLQRLIAVAESSHARLSARGADATDAAALLAKLKHMRAALEGWFDQPPYSAAKRESRHLGKKRLAGGS